MPNRETVLVTGGASGIGRAIVEAVLAQGWRAVVADVDQTALDRCRADWHASADALRFERLDVSDETDVGRVVRVCEAEFGPLTGLVNLAGTGRDVPALDTGADLFRRLLDINLVGSFSVAREIARAMRARGPRSPAPCGRGDRAPS